MLVMKTSGSSAIAVQNPGVLEARRKLGCARRRVGLENVLAWPAVKVSTGPPNSTSTCGIALLGDHARQRLAGQNRTKFTWMPDAFSKASIIGAHSSPARSNRRSGPPPPHARRELGVGCGARHKQGAPTDPVFDVHA